MKTILILGLLSLTGCGIWNRTVANFVEYQKTCVEGVQYLQFPSGATVQYDKENNVVVCK